MAGGHVSASPVGAGRGGGDGSAARRGARRLERLRLRRGEAWTPELLLLTGLLTVTALFGRPFSKLGVPGMELYITEIVLAPVVALALWRYGLRAAVARIRQTIPLLPLAVFWLAGLVATLRGLREFDFAQVVQDVGLVEYSLLLPLAALVIDTRAKARLLLTALAYAGLGTTVVYYFLFFEAPESSLAQKNPPAAVAIYMALLVVPVLARASHGLRVHAFEILAIEVALLMMFLMGQRSIPVALAGALLMLLVLARSRRRVVTAAIAGGAVSAAFLLAVVVGRTPGPAGAPLATEVGRGFSTGDSLAPFRGGVPVVGDAARGKVSREVKQRDILYLPVLEGLRRGTQYTVAFSVRPLTPKATRGIVGAARRHGWGVKTWKTKPSMSWQRVQATLTATAPTEYLRIAVESGAERARFDDFSLSRGAGTIAASGGGSGSAASENERPADRAGRAAPPAPPPPLDTSAELPLIASVRHSFDKEGYTEASTNVRWRLALWRHLLERTAEQPVAGVGFGRPTRFRWHGLVHDVRSGDAGGRTYASAPHNSFVNLLFRTGLLGFVPLLVLVAIAARRALSFRKEASDEDRAQIVSLAALFVFIVGIAGFNVALENPYMGMFFWLVLGLLLIVPKLGTATRAGAGPTPG